MYAGPAVTNLPAAAGAYRRGTVIAGQCRARRGVLIRLCRMTPRPPAAATYAIDRDVADRWHIRRHGFHGTSHQYVSERAAAFLGRPLDGLNSDCAASG